MRTVIRHACESGRRASSERGFTLVEAVITVAIVALVAGVVIPAMSGMSRAELRKSARILSGHIRNAYDTAALNGEIVRMAFDVGKSTVKVSSTSQPLAYEEGSNVLVNAAKASKEVHDFFTAPLDALDARSDSDEDKSDRDSEAAEPPGSAFSALMNINLLGGGGAAGGDGDGFSPLGEFTIEDGVKVLDVWTDGAGQAVTEGEAYLYFFPHGYTEEAIINLGNDEGGVFAVKVRGLTGKVELMDHYVEAKK